jgi:hypothetical protein
VAVTNELAAAKRKEAGAVKSPQKFHIVSELSGCDGWVSTMVGNICSIPFGCGEEVAKFGGVVKGSGCGVATVFSCIYFEVGVY